MTQFILSTIGAAIGLAVVWAASTFVGGPVRRFFDLRGEVIRRLTEFANVRARWQTFGKDDGIVSTGEPYDDLSAEEIAPLKEAQRVFRDLAAQMRAFAENELLAARLVRRLFRYDAGKASAGLIGLSNSYAMYGEDRISARRTIETALRIKSSRS